MNQKRCYLYRRYKETASEYSASGIYNVDDNGIFFKQLLSKTYVTTDKAHRSVQSTKHMGAKDRIKTYVCAHADGSLIRAGFVTGCILHSVKIP